MSIYKKSIIDTLKNIISRELKLKFVINNSAIKMLENDNIKIKLIITTLSIDGYMSEYKAIKYKFMEYNINVSEGIYRNSCIIQTNYEKLNNLIALYKMKYGV